MAFRELIGAYIDEYWPARTDETFTVRFSGGTSGRPELASLLLGAAAGAAVAPVVAGAPEFVEAARRATDSAEYLFLLNHSPAEPATVPVAPGGTDLITGNQVTGPVTLSPLAVAVVAYRRQGHFAGYSGAVRLLDPCSRWSTRHG